MKIKQLREWEEKVKNDLLELIAFHRQKEQGLRDTLEWIERLTEEEEEKQNGNSR